jgi:hypothetical protein
MGCTQKLRGNKKHTKFWWENVLEGGYLEGSGKTVIKRILEKQVII